MKQDNKLVEVENDYQVHSKIANSGGLGGLAEGYPMICRGVFDRSYTDPDECEYSCDQHEYEEVYSEGYAIQYHKKNRTEYDG